jgi:phosphate transport system permease protein
MPATLPSPAAEAPKQAPARDRFTPPRSALLLDGFMNYFIRFGGMVVVVAVMGIFVFIGWQVLPLFLHAKVKPSFEFSLAAKDYRYIGIDEWAEYPFVVEPDGALSFIDIAGKRGIEKVDLGLGGKEISAISYRPVDQRLAYGTADGQFCAIDLNYSRSRDNAGKDVVAQGAKATSFYQIGPVGGRIKEIAYADSETTKLAAAISEVNGQPEVHAMTLNQKRTLLGAGKIEPGVDLNLTAQIKGKPEKVLVNSTADGILVSTDAHEIYYFFRQGDEISVRQVFKPFKDQADSAIASMRFLLGDVSVVLASHGGVNRVFSLFVPPGGRERLFGQTKEFAKLPAAPTFFAASQRTKGFLIGGERFVSLRYATTESVRWEDDKLPFRAQQAVLSGKNNRIVFLDTDKKLHIYELNDPHPESSFKGLFGKIWYEGADRPAYVWQSTGGSDDFEPKLSLVPLIVGTLKGTLYAMLFALPIALLAAVYTSQFLHPNTRRIVKPTMEVMASLPSVVLGFLAALWLAPLIETRVPSIILMVIGIPLTALAIGALWARLPIRHRRHIKPGYEYLAFLPILALTAFAAWKLGPVFERFAFVVTEPNGAKIADFRRWWPHVTGAPYEQRNSLVVGFMMGFAVIPIIFTIAEDALSNVPGALRSGSLALGASRWQTALHIVLPTASAGIFSGVMIGLGRAVGETMIVVMATGNTPIMDLNIFSGMRTLSANIAVELPEAPAQGTLYRALFLGAMALFLMTFAVNTVAELMRQRLRDKYKTV